jgi:hypothetical protein
MATIESGTGIVTHINVFTVEPDKQQELITSLTETVNEARNVEAGSPLQSTVASTARRW